MDQLTLFQQQLLCHHEPGKSTYVTTLNWHSEGSVITTTIETIDSAYATLEQKGFVSKDGGKKVMPSHGAKPKNVFTLTETGVEEKKRLMRDQSN